MHKEARKMTIYSRLQKRRPQGPRVQETLAGWVGSDNADIARLDTVRECLPPKVSWIHREFDATVVSRIKKGIQGQHEGKN